MASPLSALGETGASHRRRPAPGGGIQHSEHGRWLDGAPGRDGVAPGVGERPAIMSFDEEEEDAAGERSTEQAEAEAPAVTGSAAVEPTVGPGLIRVGSMC